MQCSAVQARKLRRRRGRVGAVVLEKAVEGMAKQKAWMRRKESFYSQLLSRKSGFVRARFRPVFVPCSRRSEEAGWMMRRRRRRRNKEAGPRVGGRNRRETQDGPRRQKALGGRRADDCDLGRGKRGNRTESGPASTGGEMVLFSFGDLRGG